MILGLGKEAGGGWADRANTHCACPKASHNYCQFNSIHMSWLASCERPRASIEGIQGKAAALAADLSLLRFARGQVGHPTWGLKLTGPLYGTGILCMCLKVILLRSRGWTPAVTMNPSLSALTSLTPSLTYAHTPSVYRLTHIHTLLHQHTLTLIHVSLHTYTHAAHTNPHTFIPLTHINPPYTHTHIHPHSRILILTHSHTTTHTYRLSFSYICPHTHTCSHMLTTAYTHTSMYSLTRILPYTFQYTYSSHLWQSLPGPLCVFVS